MAASGSAGSTGFEAIDVVDALGPMWTMTPDDDELFEVLEQKIYEKLLNLKEVGVWFDLGSSAYVLWGFSNV